jgi:hypothetical protein
MIRLCAACGASLVLALISRTAGAQLHGDVGLEAGVEEREDAGVGPTFGLSAHVALLPLLRAGAYVSEDISPVKAKDTREITSAGLSLRLLSPWPRGALRTWLGVGFGYASVYAPSYVETLPSGATATVESAWGGFFEAPLGIGASLRFARSWELVVEAGARIGFGFTGSMYNPGSTVTSSGSSPQAQPAAGDDSLGVFLAIGLAFEL